MRETILPLPSVSWQMTVKISDEPPASSPAASEEYVNLFWRAYLGSNAFSLWDVLRSLPWYVALRGGRWPSIGQLAQLTGNGMTRHTIVGRPASGNHPAQAGVVNRLADEALISFAITGEAKGRRYYFSVHSQLPMLTPAQVGQLPATLRRMHANYLALAGILSWETITSPTLLVAPPAPEVPG